MASDWSSVEVEAVVSDYLDLLAAELRREPYSKTTHRRALAAKLDSRSDGSIERKHQNISAVLIELRYPFIFCYKPLGNFQALLGRVVSERIGADAGLAGVVQEAVAAPAPVPTVDDILARLESPPEHEPLVYPPVGERSSRSKPLRRRVSYLELEARNSSLGRAGEEFVVNYERARLLLADRPRLADQVEHVALSEGDGAGFDIRSFEVDGSDRLIEVKTTAYGKLTPIFLSINEREVSRARARQYHLYRPFHFREDPKLFTLQGALDDICRLEPITFRGRFT